MALTMDWNDLLADLPRYVQGSLKTKCAIANCSRQFFNYSEESITSTEVYASQVFSIDFLLNKTHLISLRLFGLFTREREKGRMYRERDKREKKRFPLKFETYICKIGQLNYFLFMVSVLNNENRSS